MTAVRILCLAMSTKSHPKRFTFDTSLIQQDMVERGWLPIDLARAAEVADMTVYRFLDGRAQTARTAKKLADALNRDVGRYLLLTRSTSRKTTGRRVSALVEVTK